MSVLKSITPIFIGSDLCFYNKKVPINYKIHTFNLFISSLLYHYGIEYNSKYKELFYIYDRFSINLLSMYRVLNNELLSLLYSIIFIKSEKAKTIAYSLGVLNVLYRLKSSIRMILIINLIISFRILFSQKRTNTSDCFTLRSKLIWHFTQSIYIYIASLTY